MWKHFHQNRSTNGKSAGKLPNLKHMGILPLWLCYLSLSFFRGVEIKSEANKNFSILNRYLMRSWRKNSWNPERMSSVFTFVSVCLISWTCQPKIRFLGQRVCAVSAVKGRPTIRHTDKKKTENSHSGFKMFFFFL